MSFNFKFCIILVCLVKLFSLGTANPVSRPNQYGEGSLGSINGGHRGRYWLSYAKGSKTNPNSWVKYAVLKMERNNAYTKEICDRRNTELLSGCEELIKPTGRKVE